MDRPRSIAEVMADIRQDLGGTTAEIDPDQIGSARLEELGDAVMEGCIGNHQMHEAMDNMMGGEGSASLAAMHRQIGYRYLDGGQGWMMPSMWQGMTAERTTGDRRNFGFPSGFARMMRGGLIGVSVGMLVLGILFVGLTTLAIIALIRYISHPTSSERSVSALEVLKSRYARGEIGRDEFEEKRKDLGNGS